MNKDFDSWNKVKKEVESKETSRDFFFYEREVWWCSLGINIGVEADGKNENFERPVLILKKFNGLMFWGLPLTSKEKVGDHYFKVTHEKGTSWVALTQVKVMSTKRLFRKIGMIPEVEFADILDKLIFYIKQSDPATSCGVLGGRSH